MAKFKCPCCGYYTLKSSGEYEICKVCFWEDDPLLDDESEKSSANHNLSLSEARQNYREFGACAHFLIKHVRKPNNEDLLAE